MRPTLLLAAASLLPGCLGLWPWDDPRPASEEAFRVSYYERYCELMEECDLSSDTYSYDDCIDQAHQEDTGGDEDQGCDEFDAWQAATCLAQLERAGCEIFEDGGFPTSCFYTCVE